jgi:hypothetical protein
MWGAIIWCVTELALGYLQSQSHNSQDQSDFYLQKLSDIQSNIQQLAHAMQDLKSEIKQAVEMINRDVHESLMLDHLADMYSYEALIVGNFQQLNTIAHAHPDQNNLNNQQVRTWVNELTSHRDNLFRSVNAFAKQDGGAIGKNPTVQTLVCCAPSIALWGRAYQMIDSYNPVDLQIPVNQHAVSQTYKAILLGFFGDVEQLVANDESQLIGSLLVPGGAPYESRLLKFQDHHFVYSDIPRQSEYPAQVQYQDLYYWQPFDHHDGSAGLWGTKVIGNKYVWQKTPSTQESFQVCERLRLVRKSIEDRYSIYAPILGQRDNVIALFERPTFSDRVSFRMKGSSTRDEQPTFYISVLNEGPEGTVLVTEYINENESTEVFRKMMRQNEKVDYVECIGSGYKRFHWKNVASGNEGNEQKADGLTLHVDPQGRTK